MTTKDVDRLFEPMSAGEFLSSYWGRRPAYVPGRSDKFEHLRFDEGSFRKICRSGPGEIRAQYKAAGQYREFLAKARDHEHLFDAGLTVVLNHAERYHTPLATYGFGVKHGLNASGVMSFTAIWSPAGGGFPVHFDRQGNFILQLAGEKLWRYTEGRACEFPLVNYVNQGIDEYRNEFPWSDLAEPPTDGWHQTRLRPGDLLYLPPGTWHTAEADQFSLALTFTLHPYNFTKLIQDYISDFFTADARWREFIPLSLGRESPFLGLPPDVESFLAERVTDLQKHLATITTRDLISRYRESIFADAPPAAAPASDDIRLGIETKLRVAHPFECAPHVDCSGSPVLHLFFANHNLEMPLALAPVLRHLSESPTFLAGEAATCTAMDWGDVKIALENLLAHGLLAIETDLTGAAADPG